MKKPKIQYVIDGNQVISVINLGGGYCVPAGDIFYIDNAILYDNKEDAMYQKLLRDLGNGKDLKNFKSSPYYNMYVERLKEENPEFII